MYNVRLVNYPRGAQVRVYDKLYHAPVDDMPEKKDGPDNLDLNPFTGEMERIRTKEEIERSKAVSMARTINRVYYLARSNPWDWFVTLTFDPAKVDSYNYDDCTKRLSKWLNNCKAKAPRMKYIVVPELHKSGRYHFHGLFYDCDSLGFVESGKTTEEGQLIYNIGSYRMGWTTATRIQEEEAASKYMLKYLTKDLCAVTPGKRRYWASRGLNEAEVMDLVVEGDDMKEFLRGLAEGVIHGKTVETPYSKIDYLELDGSYIPDLSLCRVIE